MKITSGSAWQRIQQQGFDILQRGLDRHVRLAVTGLSRSGKTAFITSLVNQLLEGCDNQHLPFFDVVRQDRFLGCRRISQPHPHIPSFRYDQALQALSSQPAQWPEPTRGLSELRLAIRFRPEKGVTSWLTDTATLFLDIVDYPGEWLLDLPMLNQQYLVWSREQLQLLQSEPRASKAASWLQKAQQIKPDDPVNEDLLRDLAEEYTELLHYFRETLGLHLLQPGRFLLPGEMSGAPLLHFFPLPAATQLEDSISPVPGTQLEQLVKRFDAYRDHVVKGFYKEHFAQFDRQIVLADCLQPLNAGPASFRDLKRAIELILESFNYGRSSLLNRLFAPKIDRLLFAATKADHITPEQHSHLVALLGQLVHGAKQHVRFDGIPCDTMALASIRATTAGYCQHQGESIPAIQGNKADTGEAITLFPGEVPNVLPNDEYWQDNHFEFVSFAPQAKQPDQPLAHIRLDQALAFLLGDKLQ
ncbi:YcjX family protein [Zooshikella ganghwensis]|uniref:YcjX family protein n=1 Tax=Zooshikella ganghwensis TaxID=202772 RepID=A0A4P9VJP1_9GAMM|nr:YcjX family protein [Zooshikella ganghwensis]RDH42739.1 YcjX family protein [Zooshikella ganghwensis]